MPRIPPRGRPWSTTHCTLVSPVPGPFTFRSANAAPPSSHDHTYDTYESITNQRTSQSHTRARISHMLHLPAPPHGRQGAAQPLSKPRPPFTTQPSSSSAVNYSREIQPVDRVRRAPLFIALLRPPPLPSRRHGHCAPPPAISSTLVALSCGILGITLVALPCGILGLTLCSKLATPQQDTR